MIDTVMLFAAGFGKRMKDLTLDMPKPLLKINNIPMIEYCLDFIIKCNKIKRVIINMHYHSDQMLEFIALYRDKKSTSNNNLPEIITIYEEVLLETGGAIKNAKIHISNSPIFIMNADTIIMYNSVHPMDHLLSYWLDKIDINKIDCLLFMSKINQESYAIEKYTFKMLNHDGKLYYGVQNNISGNISDAYLYTGLGIIDIEMIMNDSRNIFSLREYFIDNNYNIYGITLEDTKWLHANTKNQLTRVSSAIKEIQN
ncbi:MAG: sugar phosphate nucleotidyltransferase [Rickettsiaceae bacterium]